MKYVLFLTVLCVSLTGYSQNNDWKQLLKIYVVKAEGIETPAVPKAVYQTYSQNTYAYYRLMLSGLPTNSALVVNSDNDMFPLKLLQLYEKYRTDVNVINLGLLENSEYINRVQKNTMLN